ncbi:MAG: hypothetical protein HQK73_02525 [Desulfamplus sp.]|nr:hypothetical protein [Desulfamplus sp.]
MSNISQLNGSIGRFQNRGDLGQSGSLSERREALQASQNKNLELSLTTKEGDTVTLSAGSFTEFSALSYDKSGRISNGTGNASASISSREMTLASGSQFTFSVKGSLSEQEMDDIEGLVKSLDEIINKMATGDMDDAMSKALEMQEGYDSISGFEADLTYSSSYSFLSEASQQTYYTDSNAQEAAAANQTSLLDQANEDNKGVLESGLNQEDDIGLADILKDSSSRLMEMMLKELDKLREENQSVAKKSAEPVDQLLAHHIEQLEKMEQKDDEQMSLLDQITNAKKGMAEEFLKMTPEAQDFRKIASSFFS